MSNALPRYTLTAATISNLREHAIACRDRATVRICDKAIHGDSEIVCETTGEHDRSSGRRLVCAFLNNELAQHGDQRFVWVP